MQNFLDISKNDIELTVSEFLEIVNESLKPLTLTIVGEISSLNVRDSTVFFTLSDKKEEAIIECLIWRSNYNNIGIELKEGMEVKISGEPTIYKKNGRFRVLAKTIIPIGEGELRKAFEALKKILTEKGYFDISRKRQLPEYIKNIGLITADKSDAKKDFETHLGKYGYNIYFYNSRVEGIKAVSDICSGVKYFNENVPNLDLIVVTRGGGSMESLLAFNSEEIAKAVFTSKIPVLSAVGHENDVSICDLVADVRASTPTHAGKIISMAYYEIRNTLDRNIEQIISKQAANLGNLKNILLVQNSNNVLSFERSIERISQLLKNQEMLLNANNPANILKKGYAIVRSNNKVMKNATSLKSSDILDITLHNGNVEAKVTSILK